MANTSKLNKPKRRDRAYYRQRHRNRVYTELVRFIAEEAERRGITKKDLAEAIDRDPAQISRWLSGPTNFELDTLTDILLAFDAEMDHRITRFKDRAPANHAHPLVRKLGDVHTSAPVPRKDNVKASTSSNLKVDAKVQVSAQ